MHPTISSRSARLRALALACILLASGCAKLAPGPEVDVGDAAVQVGGADGRDGPDATPEQDSAALNDDSHSAQDHAKATHVVRILFDAAHSQRAGNADWIIDRDAPRPKPNHPKQETDWQGAYSAFGLDLDRAGAELESLAPGQLFTYGTDSPRDLSRFDVLILPEPNDPYSLPEQDAISTFVQQGGGLLIIGDHGGADRNFSGWDSAQVFNRLLATTDWGVKFVGEERTAAGAAGRGAASCT